MQVITDTPYTTARLMDLLSVEATTLPFTSVLVAIAMPTLAILTAHQVGTAMEAPLPGLFWQALISLLQTK